METFKLIYIISTLVLFLGVVLAYKYLTKEVVELIEVEWYFYLVCFIPVLNTLLVIMFLYAFGVDLISNAKDLFVKIFRKDKTN